MKAYLSFDLDKADDRENHALALKANSYRRVVEDFDNWLRTLTKYENKQSIKVELVRDKLRELLNGEEI